MNFKVGTRGSKLALWQTNFVIDLLKKHYPEHDFEVVIIKTKGDKIQNIALDKIGDKGLFVKEIEEKLLNDEIDFAVHSMKDMPSELPEGLIFTKTIAREDNKDVLICKEAKTLTELKEGAHVATGSHRRGMQLKKLRPDIIIEPIRGNVDTRLSKLFDDDNNLDGIIMASAGLKRLNLTDKITYYFDYDEMVPACAQGALAIEIKDSNKKLLKLFNDISDENIDLCVRSERRFMAAMDGDCHTPIGATTYQIDDEYEMIAMYGDVENNKIVKCKLKDKNPLQLAEKCALKIRVEMNK